jgi:hypothetical protein
MNLQLGNQFHCHFIKFKADPAKEDIEMMLIFSYFEKASLTIFSVCILNYINLHEAWQDFQCMNEYGNYRKHSMGLLFVKHSSTKVTTSKSNKLVPMKE